MKQKADHEVYMNLVDKFRNMVEQNSYSNSISKSTLSHKNHSNDDDFGISNNKNKAYG